MQILLNSMVVFEISRPSLIRLFEVLSVSMDLFTGPILQQPYPQVIQGQKYNCLSNFLTLTGVSFDLYMAGQYCSTKLG